MKILITGGVRFVDFMKKIHEFMKTEWGELFGRYQ